MVLASNGDGVTVERRWFPQTATWEGNNNLTTV
jgi:hypothetical protein